MPGDRLERQGSAGIVADAVGFDICIDGTNLFRCGSLFSQGHQTNFHKADSKHRSVHYP
jgi:hypothetical protein